jgi:hypothetical protein
MMFVLATVAAASPPMTCQSPDGPRTRTVEFTLVGRSWGGTWYQRNGVDTFIDPGAAVVPSAEAALDLLRPMMGAERLPTIDSGQAVGPGARYLVVWWPEPGLVYPAVEAVWVRPTETLVSLLSRTRDPPWPHTIDTMAANAVQVFRLPPGDYPPAGIVFTEVQWPADE